MTPLQQQITELWGQITAATHRFLELVAELDARQGWNGAGILSCAHWLNVYCGIGMVAAREKVRVANALRELPAINQAFGEGRVSYSKVRAMTRVATPENESILLNIAIHGTAAHVERTVRQFRRVERIEDAQHAAATFRNRFLEFRYDDDGHDILYARLPVEMAELVRRAIDRAMDLADEADEAANTVSDGPPSFSSQGTDDSAESRGARRADALQLIATQFLAAKADRTGSASDRYQVVVHIDRSELCGDGQRAGGDGNAAGSCCEIEDGPALAAATARRLACDGSLVGIVDGDDGEPLNVGRKTRAIPPALKRALKARDKGCRFPGCPHTRYTEGHHIEHWARGGETKLSNLITLCHRHHHLVHEGGYRIERTDDGVFRFIEPDGPALCDDFAIDRRFRGIAVAEFNRGRGLDINERTVVTHWQGERMDESIVMDALLAARARRESGATRE